MNDSHLLNKLNTILLECYTTIVYEPLLNEVDYTKVPLKNEIFIKKIILPNDKNSDPYVWVDRCKNYCKDKNVCILIPGRQFDIYGTRHGRGGGWYDRFLEKAPKKWIRIGITDIANFSMTQLNRKLLDEPMDWIIVNDNLSWLVYEIGKTI